jgi:hypothetical protein
MLGGGGGAAASPAAASAAAGAAGTAAPGVAELAAELERAAVTDASTSGADSGPAGGTSSSPSAGGCYFTHLVLDCDGVLVDSERASCEALRLSILEASASGPLRARAFFQALPFLMSPSLGPKLHAGPRLPATCCCHCLLPG